MSFRFVSYPKMTTKTYNGMWCRFFLFFGEYNYEDWRWARSKKNTREMLLYHVPNNKTYQLNRTNKQNNLHVNWNLNIRNSLSRSLALSLSVALIDCWKRCEACRWRTYITIPTYRCKWNGMEMRKKRETRKSARSKVNGTSTSTTTTTSSKLINWTISLLFAIRLCVFLTFKAIIKCCPNSRNNKISIRRPNKTNNLCIWQAQTPHTLVLVLFLERETERDRDGETEKQNW